MLYRPLPSGTVWHHWLHKQLAGLRTCLNGDLPVNLKVTAPSICIPLLFAACMCIFMGIRSSSHRPRRQITLLLARQLWQTVSAIAEIVIVVGCWVIDLYPSAL